MTVSALAPSLGDWAATAYAKAAAGLGALKSGASPADVAAALNLSGYYFDADSAEVPAPGDKLPRDRRTSLKALPARAKIEIAGYADDTGDAEANLALSQRRADAARDALVKAGVPADLLVAKGYGKASPIAGAGAEEDRLRNRRIAFHVLKTPAASPAAGTAAPGPAMAAAPSTLTLADDNGVANVSGAVHDDQTRNSILEALKAAFGADNVKGDVTVDAGRADAPWLANLRAALDALKLPGLKATFDGAAIKLGGAIPEVDREKIRAALGSIFGDGVTIGSLAPLLGELETAANAKAAAALGALKAGYSGDQVVGALNLSVVNFATDSAEVPELVSGLLRDAAMTIKALPSGTVIEIGGYTDFDRRPRRQSGPVAAARRVGPRRAGQGRRARGHADRQRLRRRRSDRQQRHRRGAFPQPADRVPRDQDAVTRDMGCATSLARRRPVHGVGKNRTAPPPL